jgi:hypothetical protein
MFHDLAMAIRRPRSGLQEGVEAHQAQADRTLAHGGIDGGGHPAARVWMKSSSTLSRKRMTSSMNIGSSRHSRKVSALTDDRQQTAVRSCPDGPAGVQHDLRAQVRLLDLQAQLALVLRHRAVHRVGEDQVGLAGLQADLEDLLPQVAGVDLAHHLVVLGRAQAEHLAVADGLHELVGDEMPWCRFSDLRLKSPDGLRISRNSSISGWWMSR